MRLGVAFAVLLTALAGCTGNTVELPPEQEGPATLALEQVFTGAGTPVGMVQVPGDEAMLVVSQEGTVRVWVPAEGLRPLPFLEISDRVRHNGEQGLLGLALPADFQETGAVYVHYSDSTGASVLARFRADAATLEADPATGKTLLKVAQPYPNHNGGQLAFGPDGMLYMALGDGGLAGDPEDNAQDPTTLLGSILRINPGRTETSTYSIPRDNPYMGREGADEVFLIGVRNPWRFSFDRASGDLWVADVGQDSVEEVHRLPAAKQAGANLGWPWYEGSQRFRTTGTPPSGLDVPVAEYPRTAGHCAITGGYVYRGASIPHLQGDYLMGDFCSGTMWVVHGDGTLEQVLDTDLRIASFAQDKDGELYVLHHGGTVWRVVAA